MRLSRISKDDPRYYGRNLPDYRLDEPEDVIEHEEDYDYDPITKEYFKCY